MLCLSPCRGIKPAPPLLAFQGSPHGWLPMARVGGRGSKDSGAETGGRSSEGGVPAPWHCCPLAQEWAGRQGTTLGTPASWTSFTKGKLKQGEALVLCLSRPAPGTHGRYQLPAQSGSQCMASPSAVPWELGVWVWTQWPVGRPSPHGQPRGLLIRRDSCQSRGEPPIKQTSISRWPEGSGKRPSPGGAHISGGKY